MRDVPSAVAAATPWRWAATGWRGTSVRAVLVTQVLGAGFALVPWLESGEPVQRLMHGLVHQAIVAQCVMMATLAADAAVRSGYPLLKAFVWSILGASGTAAIVQAIVARWVIPGAPQSLERVLGTFLEVGGLWGTAVMVYLNRQSAARTLADVRANEWQRLAAERRLIASRLHATQVQIDPASVLGRLREMRRAYGSGEGGADALLEELIRDLRDSVARTTAATAETVGGMRP